MHVNIKLRVNLKKKSYPAYQAAYRNNCLHEVCAHMIETCKPNGYWTKERVFAEALKHQRKSDFRDNAGSAYNKAYYNGWLDDACAHMEKPYKWTTKERVLAEALKYKHRGDFSIYSGGAYHAAIDRGWLDEVCAHMKPIGNYKKRMIYAYEFDDNHVYVGLTYSIKKKTFKSFKK